MGSLYVVIYKDKCYTNENVERQMETHPNTAMNEMQETLMVI